MAANDVRSTLETMKAVGDIYLPQNGQRALEDVIRALGHDPVSIGMHDQQMVANRLSEMVRKDPPWTRSYLRNILNGHQQASPKFIDACYRLGAVIDETPMIIAQATQVTVMAVGVVKAGALILADSRRCGNPGCRIEFVPRVPWQRCHSAECAAVVRSLRNAQGTKKGVK